MKSIFQAALEDDVEILRVLLATDSSLVNSVESASGWSAVHYAAHGNAIRAMRLLHESGANCNQTSSKGETPLLLVTNETMLAALLASGSQFSEPYKVLKSAQTEQQRVQFDYSGHRRTIKVIQLGVTEGQERCFGWQYDGTPEHPEPGLRCFRVAQMSELLLTAPVDDVPEDLSRARACVAVVDRS